MTGPESLSTVQRAFELAADGTCQTLDDVRRKLTAERYSNIQAHLEGRSIRLQLKQLMAGAGEAAKTAAAK